MAEENWEQLRQRLIGFGEHSSRKSYYPELQRKLAELKVSEERFRTLVNTIPDLIWLKDADGIYLSCNRMFERFFGAVVADIVGKTDYDFVGRELADSFREHDRKAMAAGKPTSNEEWITFADDHHRALLDTTKTPMYDANSELIGVLGVARDITERKQAEEELKREIAERKRAEEDLRNLNEELERRVKLRTAELEKNNAELYRMNRLFVDRELKMVELKEKLHRLEEIIKVH